MRVIKYIAKKNGKSLPASLQVSKQLTWERRQEDLGKLCILNGESQKGLTICNRVFLLY